MLDTPKGGRMRAGVVSCSPRQPPRGSSPTGSRELGRRGLHRQGPRPSALPLLAIALMVGALLPVSAAAAPQPLATTGVDLAFEPPGLVLSESEPFTDGSLWVNGTVFNNGTVAATASALFYLGNGLQGQPFFTLSFSVNDQSTAVVSAPLSTQDLVGYQQVTVRLTGITPAESATADDNEATVRFKVHVPGEVDLSGTWQLDQQVNTTGFVTLRDNASLVIGPQGALWVGQQWPDQFEVLVRDNATLAVAGGALTSPRPIHVVLQDNGTLTVTQGGQVTASLTSTSAGTSSFVDSTLLGERLEVRAGTASFVRSTVTVAGALLEGGTLVATSSVFTLGAGLAVRGPAFLVATDSTLSALAVFGSPPEAEAALPGISSFLQAGHGPYFPAVNMTGASVGTLVGTTVSSTVLIEGTSIRSDIPVLAHEGARAEVSRYASVEVSDPNGVPVANASVVVRESTANATVAANVLAANGTARVPLLTDIVAYGTTLPVGHYKVSVSRGSVSAPVINLTFAQAPDYSPQALSVRVPVTLDIYEPWDIYDSYQFFNTTNPQTTQVWNTSFVFRTSTNFTGVDILLVQSRPFERFVAFDGGAHYLLEGAVIRSEFPFNLYLLNGSTADIVSGSRLVNANVIVAAGGVLQVTASRLTGSLLAVGAEVSLERALVWGPRVDASLSRFNSSDSVVAADTLLRVTADFLSLARTGLSGQWVPAEAATMPLPTYADFAGLVGSSAAELVTNPEVCLTGRTVEAEAITVWTGGAFCLEAGNASTSTVLGARAVTGLAVFGAWGGQLVIEESWVDPETPVDLRGDGVVLLRGLASAVWTVAPALTVRLFESIVVGVRDDVGLPVEGVLVTASALLSGDANETAVTDATGAATLYLHRSSMTPAGSEAGATYFVVATKGTQTSQRVTWDPTSDADIQLTLPGTYATPSADALFAITYPGNPARLLASSVGIEAARSLLGICTGSPVALSGASVVFPGERLDLCLAADLLYTQGGEVARRPMAGGTFDLVAANGTTVASGTLDAAGVGVASFLLPGVAGNATYNLTLNAPALAAAVTLSAVVNVAAPPKLVLTVFLLKPRLEQRETIKFSGKVTYANGSAAGGATLHFTMPQGEPPRDVAAGADGSLFAQGRTGSTNGTFMVTIVATAPRTSPSDPVFFNYTVGANAQTPPPGGSGSGQDSLLLFLATAMTAVFGAAFFVTYQARRASRGDFVECGNCGKPTLAGEKRCTHCNTEFEGEAARCSKCAGEISVKTSSCPWCGTSFTKAVARGEASPAAGSDSGPREVEYLLPEGAVPESARRAAPQRLEELEFRLPGTAQTMDLGEAAGAPSFAPASASTPPPPERGPPPGAPGATPAPSWAESEPSQVERMGLPPRDEASFVREIGEEADDGGKGALSFGTTRPDLASAAQRQPEREEQPPASRPAGADGVPPDVLRDLLRQAAPELSVELDPSDIKKELEEIARSEAPAAAERQQAAKPSRSTKGRSQKPEDQTVEAPEKSRKSAFDVFSTPAKNIPSGFERRGSGGRQDGRAGSKGATAPVCPNCGGNWVVQRDGKNSCRVCGTRW